MSEQYLSLDAFVRYVSEQGPLKAFRKLSLLDPAHQESARATLVQLQRMQKASGVVPRKQPCEEPCEEAAPRSFFGDVRSAVQRGEPLSYFYHLLACSTPLEYHNHLGPYVRDYLKRHPEKGAKGPLPLIGVGHPSAELYEF